ncbi:unnamed protein product [Calicophoron daubneyi]|uniref:RING-type domain-containing protein n=1 Tax=Calicophoron daubneyi TaxID=300641 RepID=A0AAV2T2Z3_CALDB
MAEAQVRDQIVLLNYKKIDNILQCSICSERFREATCLPCMHTFCGRPCLVSIQGAGYTVCPYCREPFSYARIKRNLLVDNLVSLINQTASNLTECTECNRQVLRRYSCSHCGDNLCRDCCKQHFLQTRESLESYINKFMGEINMNNCDMLDEKTIHQGLLIRLGESLKCSLTSIQAYGEMWKEVTRNIPEISLEEISGELKSVEEETLSLKRRLGMEVDTRETHEKLDSRKAWDTVYAFYEIFREKYTFFIILDSISQWPELYQTGNTAPITAVAYLGEVFCRMGVPSTVVTTASAEFSSAIFADFCRNNGIRHVSRPNKNRFSNHFLTTFHRWVETVHENNLSEEAIQNFLLDYRSSVCPDLPEECTPAEKLIGRKLRVNVRLRDFTFQPPSPQYPPHPLSRHGTIPAPPPFNMAPRSAPHRRKRVDRSSMRVHNQTNTSKTDGKMPRKKRTEAEDPVIHESENLKAFDGSSLIYEDGTVVSLDDIKPKFVASTPSQKKAPAEL